MKLKQLSLFLENRPGHLLNACRIIADAGLNVETMTLADTEQYGILRILVRDWEKGLALFESCGIVVKVTDVLAVCVPDQPGGLAGLLAAFTGSDINIEYMYGFNSHIDGKAIIVLRLDRPDEAIQLLEKAHVHVLSREEVFRTEAQGHRGE